MSNLIKVFSWPRSGTNLLMSLLKERYYPKLDLSAGTGNEVDFFDYEGKKTALSPWLLLLGGHWYDPQAAIENNHLDDINKSIYIYRDFKNILASLWLLRKFQLNRGLDIEDYPTFGEFIRGKMPIKNKKNKVPDISRIEMWKWSIKKWANFGCYTVKYEDLVDNPNLELSKIDYHFKMNPLSYKTTSNPVGYNPSSIGDISNENKWKKYFSEEDLDYYNSIIPKNFLEETFKKTKIFI